MKFNLHPDYTAFRLEKELLLGVLRKQPLILNQIMKLYCFSLENKVLLKVLSLGFREWSFTNN